MPNLITEDVATEVRLVATAGQTTFSFNFPIFEAGDLVVLVDDVVTSPSSISGVGDEDGGSITLPAQAAGTVVVLQRLVPIRRSVDLPSVGPYTSDNIDDEFDRVFAIQQQQQTVLGRALVAPVGESMDALPAAADRAYKAVAFDENGALDLIDVFEGAAVPDLTVDLDEVDYLASGTGAVARSATVKLSDIVSVKDFGAVGNGTANDTAAIAAAYASGARAVYFPKGTYLTTAEINAFGIMTIGEGYEGTIIKANAAMRSVLKLTGQQNSIRDIGLDANDLANYGIYCHNSNGSLADTLVIRNFLLDGVHFPSSGNNSNTTIRQSLIRDGGSEYSTGTVSATSGGTVATITGAVDLTTLGIRPKLDYIKITGDIARTISSVTANTITLNAGVTFPATYSGVTYKILRGHCIAIDVNGDNSHIKIENCELGSGSAVKGSGIRDAALYGAHAVGNIYESLEYGFHTGNADGSQATIGARDVGGYYEIMGSRSIYIEQSNGGYFAPAQCEGQFNGIHVESYIRVPGVIIDLHGERLSGRHVTFTNIVAETIGFEVTYDFVQSSGATNFELTLPAITANNTEWKLRDAMGGHQIVLNFYNIGGKTCTIKSADYNVNGVAGTTGIAVTGNYQRKVCTWNAGEGWLVA